MSRLVHDGDLRSRAHRLAGVGGGRGHHGHLGSHYSLSATGWRLQGHVYPEAGRREDHWHISRRVQSGIAAVILFTQYPFLLPIVLTGWAWRLSPGCIKPPIIDFALDMIIRGARVVPDFLNFGEAWARRPRSTSSTRWCARDR